MNGIFVIVVSFWMVYTMEFNHRRQILIAAWFISHWILCWSLWEEHLLLKYFKKEIVFSRKFLGKTLHKRSVYNTKIEVKLII